MRGARAVMHAQIVNLWFPLKSYGGETFPVSPEHAQPATYASGKRPMPQLTLPGLMNDSKKSYAYQWQNTFHRKI